MTNKVKPLTTFLKKSFTISSALPSIQIIQKHQTVHFQLAWHPISIFFQPTHFFTVCGGYLSMRRRVLPIICAIGLNAINRAE